MNFKQNMFSKLGALSRYKAVALVKIILLLLKNMLILEEFTTGTSSKDKLQIRYANLRV